MPGLRVQSATRVFADHEWVQSSASPASAGAAGSGWSSRVLSPSAAGLWTALGTDTGDPLDSLVSFTPRTRGGGGTQPSYSLFLLANLGDKGGGSPATRKAQDIRSSAVEK